jgi:hypothetical protein
MAKLARDFWLSASFATFGLAAWEVLALIFSMGRFGHALELSAASRTVFWFGSGLTLLISLVCGLMLLNTLLRQRIWPHRLGFNSAMSICAVWFFLLFLLSFIFARDGEVVGEILVEKRASLLWYHLSALLGVGIATRFLRSTASPSQLK